VEFDQPQRIGQKRGSFATLKFKLHGPVLVVQEHYEPGLQEEDQIELERESFDTPKNCVYLYRGTSADTLQLLNTICAGRLAGEAKRVLVSPSADFIAVESTTTPVIIGRDYRKTGSGPTWLDNGERP
jgi:hypothetical protein